MGLQPNIRPAIGHHPHKRTGKTHRPEARILRNHFKLVRFMYRVMKSRGHHVGRSVYWYGRTTVYCQTCGHYWRIGLYDKDVPIPHRCPGKREG